MEICLAQMKIIGRLFYMNFNSELFIIICSEFESILLEKQCILGGGISMLFIQFSLISDLHSPVFICKQ